MQSLCISSQTLQASNFFQAEEMQRYYPDSQPWDTPEWEARRQSLQQVLPEMNSFELQLHLELTHVFFNFSSILKSET